MVMVILGRVHLAHIVHNSVAVVVAGVRVVRVVDRGKRVEAIRLAVRHRSLLRNKSFADGSIRSLTI